MSRGYDPENFSGREFPAEKQKVTVAPAALNDEFRDQAVPERSEVGGTQIDCGLSRSPRRRKVYEIRGRTYRLRSSEIGAMVEVGKFRSIAAEDLAEFFYNTGKAQMKREVENLIRKGLLQTKSIPYEKTGSRQLLALTKAGHRLVTENGITGKHQVIYHGFSRPREAHHDADLYRLYRKASEKIACEGGRNFRVVLDYELQKHVNHDLAGLGRDGHSSEREQTVAEQHGLQVVSGKIPVPDIRIEYQTQEGERARADIELATSHYRGRNLQEKVRAGFAIYARAEEAAKLRRVLEQRELIAEILSL
jgi:hypothetical protein